MTVPQLKPLCRLLVALLGTQGSWNVLGDDVGVCRETRSTRGPDEQEDLERRGRRLRESERTGGRGGRFDLRREMLWMAEREEEEGALCFLFSWFCRSEDVSEQTEVLSVREGEERPERRSGWKLQSSREPHLVSDVTLFQSPPVWLLWTLGLEQRGR